MLFTRLCAALIGFSVIFTARASNENCFIAKENGQVVKEQGACDKTHAPYSTFKIPIALMGFEAGILKNSDTPTIKFNQEIEENIKPFYNPQKYPIQMYWLRDHTPASWMKYSVVWFSQEITRAIGMDKFKSYILKLDYGNHDVSGNPGKEDGLTQAWLNSSLKISPRQQVEFIEKLSDRTLPLSKESQESTIKLIFLENVYDWRLYGKTGGGMVLGWFVGWIEKDSRKIVFAQYIKPDSVLISGGRTAKELAQDNLVSVILSK